MMITPVRLVFVASLFTASVALASTPNDALPPVQKAGSVTYMTGGIGSDAWKAMEEAAPAYPLELEFAVRAKPHDDFIAEVDVNIMNAQGHAVLSTTATGPFLLAKLPPGHYHIQATVEGKTLQRQVEVSSAHRRVFFEWPAEPGMMASGG
jgi:hypothetical protein